MSNLCKTESNLSLLSSRISSILDHSIKQKKKERISKVNKTGSHEDVLRSNNSNNTEEPLTIESKVQEEL